MFCYDCRSWKGKQRSRKALESAWKRKTAKQTANLGAKNAVAEPFADLLHLAVQKFPWLSASHQLNLCLNLLNGRLKVDFPVIYAVVYLEYRW